MALSLLATLESLPPPPPPPLLSPSPVSSYSPKLPTELWRIIFEFATETALFFENRWTYVGQANPFDEAELSSPSTSLDAFPATVRANTSILLVCKRWHAIARGLLWRRIVIRRRAQLDCILRTLEASADKRMNHSTNRSSSLGWHVTHLKMMVTVHGTAEKEQLTRTVQRLLKLCPRLIVFIDAAPYGLQELSSPFLASCDDETAHDAVKSLRSLVWSYGGPKLFDLESMSHILSLRSITIHSPTPSDPPPTLPISVPTLTALDLSIAWNNHAHWRFVAEHVQLPSLRSLTVRTPATGDGAMSVEAYSSLHTFLSTHGSSLQSLDICIVPRAVEPSARLVLGAQTTNQTDIGQILQLCPNLTDLVISARWLDHVTNNDGEVAAGEATGIIFHNTPSNRSWSHLKLRRVGLRDVACDDRAREAAETRNNSSTGIRGAERFSHRVIELLLQVPTRSVSPSFFEWVVQMQLQDRSVMQMPKRLKSMAATVGTLLSARLPTPGHGLHSERTTRMFPDLRAIRLLDSSLSDTDDRRMSSDDKLFWKGWATVAAQRGVIVEDCFGCRIAQ
ncbi:hypothetical protein DL93DRAFT_1063679 [Clavulina sp. PMI_390]|nr:hypothetical protein DL93DRAFT_1063679 [Clavulina sp. PMI_390]